MRSKATRTLGLMMLSAFGLLTACYNDFSCGFPVLLCYENACKPYGTCVMEGNGAVCKCHSGYYQDDPRILICNRHDAFVGEACKEDEDCISDRCLRSTGDAEGYCTTTNCQTDDECINHADNEHAEMCCLQVDVGFFICLKIAEGYECGDGTGTCGSACTGNMDSACDIEHFCLRAYDTDPHAICSAPCATDADCVDCEWSEDPEALISCTIYPSGNKYCMLGNGGYCVNDADCAEGQTCQQFPNLAGDPWLCVDNKRCAGPADCPEGKSCRPTLNVDAIIGWCHENEGSDPVGTACDEDNDSCEVFCIGHLCSEWCSSDEDCPDDMRCETIYFCNGMPCQDPNDGRPGTVCLGP